MSLVESLLTAIVRLEGDALVMHVGEKPYVVTTSESASAFRGPLSWGQVELSTRVLTVDAVAGMLAHLLPEDQRAILSDVGAVEYHLPEDSVIEGRFTVIAARGGDDIWLEVRHRRPEPVAPAVEVAEVEPPVEPERPVEVQPAAAVAEPAEAAPPAEVPQPAAVEPPVEVEEPAQAAHPVEVAQPIVVTEPAEAGEEAPAEEPAEEPAAVEATLQPVMEAPPAPVTEAPPAPVMEAPPEIQVVEAEPEAVAVAPHEDDADVDLEIELEPVEPAVAVTPDREAPEGVPDAQGSEEEEYYDLSLDTLANGAIEFAVTPMADEAAPEPAPEPVAVEETPVPQAEVVPAPAPEPTPEPVMVEETPAPQAEVVPEPVPEPTPEPVMVEETPAPQAEVVPEPVPEPTPEPMPVAETARPAVVLPLARPGVRGGERADEGATIQRTTLDRLLRVAAARGASALYIVTDTRPAIRVDGEIQILDGEEALGPSDVATVLMELAPEPSRQALQKGAVTEWIVDVAEVGRVRCMSFHDHRGQGGIFRMLPARALSVEQLGLSREIQSLCRESEGLVLVTGPRSSGKSTLVSAFVDLINRTRADHVITLEGQIKFVHESRRSLVSQRELRGDAAELKAAVRAALREDPDVLVIEDLRSPELLAAALEAAESGRLVFGALPAASTVAAIERIVDQFPQERRAALLSSLASTLRGVVTQVLLRKIGGGRVAAREILLNTPSVAALIADGETRKLLPALDTGRKIGMAPLNDALVSFVRSGAVAPAEAYRKSADREGLLVQLRREGIDTSFVERLA